MEVFELFEGTCPICHTDVVIKHASGTERFLREFIAEGDQVQQQVWESGTWGSTDGELTFQCVNRHEMTVGHNVYGDWNL